MECPQCAKRLKPADSDWHRCDGCGYEISGDALQLYTELVDALEANPGKFFADVEQRLSELRALEPVWQRTRL
ncbi:hypothetical protein ABT010_35840 [Streptomyces sp. NPDC002668]|uniref:hypothetical protein n=1 Tax=Streptomyces sp. NPDC002668 TaxID=3154422 RepID=UPI0033309516